MGDETDNFCSSWLNLKVHPSLRSRPLPIIPFCFPSRAKEAKQQKKKIKKKITPDFRLGSPRINPRLIKVC